MKLFELFAELSLNTNNFNAGITSATKQGKSFASTMSGGFNAITAKSVAVGHALYDMGKMAVRAAASFSRSVVTAYADTEQLIGGIETLFGKSADVVIRNSEQAYRTAGMSANEYMETVTGFSASLLQSLGGDTAAAARVADMAVQDMSDNANKMGTDMGMIMNAYQGFAKQNYTMLDNLKLGYGGTRTEMERLLRDAEAIQRAQGKNVSYSINNLDDVYEAIHVIQTEMGITGTTAEEASSTITGSLNAFRAAWSNMLSGLGTGQDMAPIVDALFETGSALISNLFALAPRIGESALSAVDRILQNFDLYRTLKNAYKVGKWEAVADAAIASFKRGVQGFGEWAIDVGSQFLAGLWTALSGNETDAENIKTFMNDLFGAAGDVLTGLGTTLKDTLVWIVDNWGKVAPIVGAMGVAFAALSVKANPLGATMTALALAVTTLTTDWAAFEEENPRIVQMFEDLTGLDFSDFTEGVESVITALNSISAWASENGDIVKTLLALVGGLAIYAGHPVIGAGLIGASWGIEDEKKFDITKYRINNSPAGETPVSPNEPGGGMRWQHPYETMFDDLLSAFTQSFNEIDMFSQLDIDQLTEEENADGEKDMSSIASLAAAASEAAAAASAAANALAGAKIEMDGQAVGNLILPTVSSGLARQIRTASRTTA